MSRKLQRAILILAILGTAGLVSFLLVTSKAPPEKKTEVALATLVDVLELQGIDEQFSIRSQGTVKPRTETVLSAEVAGSIVSISPKFVAGGLFAQDEELMRIDPTRYEVAVQQAEALLAQRQIEFDGAEKLRSQGYRAEAELASAATALAAARAGLVTARRDLEKTRIRVPYAGMVRAKETDIGYFVNPGSRLGVVFATDYAEVRLPLTDADLAFIDLPAVSGGTAGPVVRLTAVQRGVEANWQAQIVRTEGVVDEKTRVTYVVARVDDPYRRRTDAVSASALPMGTFVGASIEGRTLQDVVRVPRSALRGGDQLLFVDDDQRLQIRTVDVLRADASSAWLRNDELDGKRINLTPIESPVNGMQVRVSDTGTADVAAHTEN
ncbi:MAG: HlyD family efflux transporter periplasmic adaptor subunit [Woeseia sp.]